MHFCKLLPAWGLEWDRVGGDGAVEVGGQGVFAQRLGGRGPAVALPVTQRAAKHVMHSSAFVLLVCLSGRDNHAEEEEVVLVSAPLSPLPSPLPAPTSPPSLLSPLLHDWSLCHYFLAAGGDPGNLVNPLTTNCLLLPCCLDKQPGGGEVKPR